ncbi:MAG: SurA N-terminal domain-containing protein [Pseudomonadota bacterium]
MLDFLRRGVKTWIAKVLFALLVVSFAIFGIGDVFSFGLGSSVAQVGNQKITVERYSTALNQEIRAQSQRFGQAIDGQTARALGLDQQVLARMAQEATLDEAVDELGLSAPDDAVGRIITADPGFQNAAGEFDQETYRYRLAQANFTIEDYEEATRRSLTRSALAQALSAGARAPVGAIDTIYTYQTETRVIDYITLNAATHADDAGTPSEDDLIAYHAANEDSFTAPETREAVYLHVSIEDLAPTMAVDDQDLSDLYEDRRDEYDLPESRALYQLIFDTEEDANAALERIAAGEADFDAILAERGESRADTSLGTISAGELSTAASDAAFALPGTGIAGPVDTGFGFAIIDVAAVTPAEVTPFEDARPELLLDLQRAEARASAPEIAGEIDDLRAGGATLEEIATEMGLPLLTVPGIARSGEGASGLTATQGFLTELFESEEGEERDIIETDEGGYFVLRLDGINPASVRPLDEVRDLAATGWQVEALRRSLEEKADAAIARLDSGTPLSEIATEFALEVDSEGPKSRIEGWQAITPELVETLFEGDAGTAGRAAAPGRIDAVVIAQVADIADAEDTDANRTLRDVLSRQMNAMAGDDVLTLYMMRKQEDVGVSVNQQVLDSVLSQTQY